MTDDELHVLYRHYDSAGELLYVGITRDPWERLHWHQKHAEWARQIASTAYAYFASRDDLEAAEVEAIHAEKPRWNITHNNGALTAGVMLRLASEDLEFLKKRAADRGTTVTEVIRFLVRRERETDKREDR